MKSFVIGITGTVGKTSTALYVYYYLNKYKKNVCYVGTHFIYYNDLKIKTNNTTLEYNTLIELFSKYDIKPKFIVMEVSSHGINQARINKIKFNIIALTNLGSDHLDYHLNINNYHKVKISFIESAYKCKVKLVNEKYINLFDKRNKITFYKQTENIINTIDTLNYNKENIYLAYLIIKKICYQNKNIINDLCSIDLNNGRGQIIKHSNRKIIVDYAHQIESFEAILNDGNYNKVVVFGCGGNRDKTKRSIMGKIACKYCKHVIITEDNSRNESIKDILLDITKDITNYRIIEKRKEAIQFAINNYVDLDIYILGKGNEDYILINNTKKPHNDIDFVNLIINKKDIS